MFDELDGEILRASQLIDEEVGVIQRIYPIPLGRNDPQLYHFVADPPSVERFAQSEIESAQGTSLDWRIAFMRAAGESLERYCSAVLDEEKMKRGTYREVREIAINPSELVFYTDHQYDSPEFALNGPGRFSDDAPLRWLEGYSLAHSRRVLVPASFVFLPYRFSSREEAINSPVSTGLAAGPILEQALVNGIYEVIERDAFMTVWLNQLHVPQVDLDATSDRYEYVDELVSRLRGKDIGVSIFDITMDVPVPSYLCVLSEKRVDGTHPGVYVGAASNLSGVTALSDAIEEAASSRLWGGYLVATRPDFRPDPAYTNIDSPDTHMLLYAKFDMQEALSFLGEGGAAEGQMAALRSEDPYEELRDCVEILTKAGFDIVYTDITTPDVRTAGFSVARVLIPRMQPLNFGRWVPLGNDRLYEAPVKAGYLKEKLEEDQLNSYPHPFP